MIIKITKLGYSEAAGLALVFIGTKAFLGYPRLISQLGFTAGWLIILISVFVSMGFWLILSALLAKYPGESLLAINEKVMGSKIGLGINMLLFVYIMLSTGSLLRQFSEAVILTALPEAPVSAVAVLFLIPAWMAAHLGLEAISRSTYISLPFILVGVLVVLLSLYPYWNIEELYPILGAGLGPVVKYGFLNSSVFGEVIILAILASYFSFRTKTLRKVGLFSLVFVGIYFILITVVHLMVIPMPMATESITPFYQLSRAIYLGRYYQRLESVFVIFWTFTAYLRLAIGVMVVALIIRDSFKIPYYQPILPAISLIIFSLALTPTDVLKAVAFERDFRLPYGWVVNFAVPCAVWGVAVLTGKKGRRSRYNGERE